MVNRYRRLERVKPYDTQDAQYKLLVRGIANVKCLEWDNTEFNVLSIDQLRQCCRAIQTSKLWDVQILRVMMLVQFFGILRPSELVSLTVDDLVLDGDRLFIRVLTSKNAVHPSFVTIDKRDDELDAVVLVRAIKSVSKWHHKRIWWRLDGEAWSYSFYVRSFKKMMSTMEFPHAHVLTPYSLRRGAVSYLVQRAFPTRLL